MAEALPVPVSPVTKRLYPLFSTSRPNWIALSALSWPMGPWGGTSSSVQLKWKSEVLHCQHRRSQFTSYFVGELTLHLQVRSVGWVIIQ